MGRPGRRTLSGAIVLGLVSIAAAYFPTIRWLLQSWVGDAYYRVGLLVPPVSLFLAWRLQRGRPVEGPARGWPLWVGLLVVTLALMAHALALHRGAYLISSVTLIFVLAGILLALAGPSVLRRQAFPLAFLLLAVPWPLLQACSPTLTQWVAEAAAALGRGMRIPVTASGANLHLPDSALDVTSPCTGIGSLMTFFAIAVLYAFLAQGPLPGKLALVLLAVPTAMVASIVRVGALVAISHYVGVDLAVRYYRLWSTALLLLVGLIFFGLVARALRCDEIRSDI